MRHRHGRHSACVLIALCLMRVAATPAQNRQGPGTSIGSISTRGDLVLLTLDEGALGKANLFDLVKHTLRFTPDRGGYRVENIAFTWDAEFGNQAPARTPVTLH